MTDQDVVIENGEGETDPKAPLADEEEEEDVGDPVPANIQAVIALCGIVAIIMLAMGLSSSEWVIAAGGVYWQGLFVYCATELPCMGSGSGSGSGCGSGSGSGVGPDSSSSSSSSSSEESLDSTHGIEEREGFKTGCYRIDLQNQEYTMLAALLISISLATTIYGLMLALLGSWVRDIDSKRKSYKLSFYLNVTCVVSNILSLILYSACFEEVVENDHLEPFRISLRQQNNWEVGWSFEIIIAGLGFQALCTLAVGYSLLLLPIIEEVEESEEQTAKEKE